MKVGVVGLGLIGGSLARDLTAAGHTVLAADRSGATLRAAMREHAIAGTLDADLDGIESLDLVVICLPVDATERFIRSRRKALARARAVTDVGSTKRTIMRAAVRAGLGETFVGSHPMAGGHLSGWSASTEGLFVGKRVYITAPGTVTPAAERTVRRLWRVVGGRMENIDAGAHDELLAATSHLPQVVALALSTLYADARITRDTLGRGGREMTRLAASNADMWAAILTDNDRNVSARLRRLRRAFAQIESAIARRDAVSIRRVMKRTNAWVRR